MWYHAITDFGEDTRYWWNRTREDHVNELVLPLVGKQIRAVSRHGKKALFNFGTISYMQVGLRRAEIASLTVEDLHQNRGYDSLRGVRKGGRHDALAIHPNTVKRLKAYLEAAGHADDLDGPLFRPLSHNRKNQEPRRHMHPDAIDRVLLKHAMAIGLDRGYSAHSMRATFITTALENGCSLGDVQRAAGHREPSTTKLYDRRGYNPEKSASYFATY